MKTTIGMALLLTGAALSQTKTALPAFEVADVQVSKDLKPQPRGSFQNSKVEVFNVSMKLLFREAWKIKDDKMLVGAPSWFDSDQFDIIAKANPNTPEDTLRLMLQSLLAERFKLTTHTEDKVVSVYALTVKKGGHKLQAAAPDGKSACTPEQRGDNLTHRNCTSVTMSQLAELLPGMAPAYVDLPAVDLTGVDGAFDFKITWVARGRLLGKGEDGQAIDPVAGLTMFEALDRLGLELKPAKRPMPALVIDHIERTPTGN